METATSSQVASGTRAVPRDDRDTPPSDGCEESCGYGDRLRILPLRIDPVTATGCRIEPTVYKT